MEYTVLVTKLKTKCKNGSSQPSPLLNTLKNQKLWLRDVSDIIF